MSTMNSGQEGGDGDPSHVFLTCGGGWGGGAVITSGLGKFIDLALFPCVPHTLGLG